VITKPEWTGAANPFAHHCSRNPHDRAQGRHCRSAGRDAQSPAAAGCRWVLQRSIYLRMSEA